MQDHILDKINALSVHSVAFEQYHTTQSLSYNELNHNLIQDKLIHLAHALRQSHQNCPGSKIVEKILSQPEVFTNSLWTHAPFIHEFLQRNNTDKALFVMQPHFNSQSLLLAMYLGHMKNKIKVYASEKQMNRGWTCYTTHTYQVDKISAVKSMLEKQKISCSFFQLMWEKEVGKNNNEVQIWDIFHTHPTIYRPFLLQKLKQKEKFSNIIVYGSISQQKQIQQLFFETKTEAETLEINDRYPFETVKIKSLQEELISFLNEEQNQPNKQDIIIFEEPSEKNVRRLKQIIKKENPEYLKSINFITGAFQIQKLPISSTSSKIATQSAISNGSSEENMSLKSFNNIFIAPNFYELISWGYDYNAVFYVFDSRTNSFFGFNYRTMVYQEQKLSYISQRELLSRSSFCAITKIGKYCYENDDASIDPHQDDYWYLSPFNQETDIGRYLIQMIKSGQAEILEGNNKSILESQLDRSRELRDCFHSLMKVNIVEKKSQTGTISLLQQNLLEYLWKIPGLNPLLCMSILQQKEDPKMSNLLAMGVSILMTPGSMRQIPTNFTAKTNRPTQIWRQTGYLHTCIDILVRTKIIEQKIQKQNEQQKSRVLSKKSLAKRLSKMNSNEYDTFGCLFQIVQACRMTFDEMNVEDLLREEFINQDVYHNIIGNFDILIECFELEEFNKFVSFEEIEQVVENLLKFTEKGCGVFSGSRRTGYYVEGQLNPIFPNKSSLFYLLNERPPFIYLVRLIRMLSLNSQDESQTKTEILMCNHMSQQQFMYNVGSFPSHKTSSFGEAQVQFHGIPSATFHYLWKSQATSDIVKFENKFECFIEPNEQLAIISIHLPKQKQNIVKIQFQSLLKKVKEYLQSETKVMNYFGSTCALLGSGGSTLQIIKDKYINKCNLDNIHLETTVEDLHELFDEFFKLKQIKFLPKNKEKENFRRAQIQFFSQKDYYRFHEYYNECQYLNRYLKVSPIYAQQHKQFLKNQMYIEFLWDAWNSSLKGFVQFELYDTVNEVETHFKQKGYKLDGKNIKYERDGNKLIFLNLGKCTDQFFFRSFFSTFGEIKSIEISKKPTKQNVEMQQEQILTAIKNKHPNEEIDLELRKFCKLKNGVRKCEVVFKNLVKLQETMVDMQNKIGVVGTGRVHLESYFIHPIKIPHGYHNLYESLFLHAQKNIPNNKIGVEHINYNNYDYLIGKSHDKLIIDAFEEQMKKELTGYPIQLSTFEANILLTDVGIQNLFDLEEKFSCRLLPNINTKTLLVQTHFDNLLKIKEEVKAKVSDSFFYRVPLTRKAFKNLKDNLSVLENMKKQYSLNILQLEEVGKNILLEGSANHVERAFNYLMHLIEVAVKSEDQLLNPDACGICCEEPLRPYRLQQCGHKFCLQCIIDTVNSALGDISMFPVKCPQCLEIMMIEDLNYLLPQDIWIRLMNISINQYIGKNSQIVSNCYTAGCKQINFIINNYFKCDACNVSFCLECKLNYHPGLTCQQAKQGGNVLFEKFMKENNIRKCPNQKCKFPIERVDGCYRVTCTRCGKSMCFKCEPDKMIAYDNYNDCYKHLSEVHNGYW